MLSISVISYRRRKIARDRKKWSQFACIRKYGNKKYINLLNIFVVLVSVVKSLLRKKRKEKKKDL